MSTIIEKISRIDKLYHSKKCSNKQIREAQNLLEMSFPDEYMCILKNYGAISFFGTEWTGLNIDGYLNVVTATNKERAINSSFPKDCFVLENQAIDGLLVIANEQGQVFSLQYSKIEKIHDSISDYLDECIKRKK